MRILVTGGGGYLGVQTAAALGADGVSRRTGWDVLNSVNVERVREYDVVVHLAAHVAKSSESAARCLEVNTGGTLSIAQRMVKGQTLILASTKDVYNSESELHQCVPEWCSTDFENQSGYAWSKKLAEDHARAEAVGRGFRLGIFRLSTVFAPPTPGNRGGWVSGFAAALRQGKPLRLKGRGGQVRDVLPAAEMTRAFQAFIRSSIEIEVFNLGGGERYAMSLAESAFRIADLLGAPRRLVELTDDETRGEQNRYVSDVRKLNRLLDWKPDFDLDAALKSA